MKQERLPPAEDADASSKPEGPVVARLVILYVFLALLISLVSLNIRR